MKSLFCLVGNGINNENWCENDFSVLKYLFSNCENQIRRRQKFIFWSEIQFLELFGHNLMSKMIFLNKKALSSVYLTLK